MTSLVVGGAGVIGRRLCQKLAESSVGTIATTRRLEHAPFHRGVRWRALDLATFTGWDDLLDGVSTVYHLAWSTIPSSAGLDPARDILENVVGSVRLMEAARRYPGIRIVFASSGGAVYGAPEQLPVAEHHPAKPLSAYGISKLMVEHYLEKFRRLHGLDGIALRIGNCYGAGQTELGGLGAVTLFTRAALRGEPVKLFGNGSTVRDYVHVDDVVSALLAAGRMHNVPGPVNIASGTGHSLSELIAKVEAAVGQRIIIEPIAARPFDVPASVLDIRRASERLGWAPVIDLDLGIEMLVNELRTEADVQCGSPFTSIATSPTISTAPKATLAP
ncbi:UDP-glucose 4-epimerase [Xanthobacter flavus]|uniref:NAD-dependent epimerase n=1 Tax=Xanthobacter flavus TaxID=281 RepID=A0A9W6CLB5_XANFL|nr:NAD-dependent epimerase/dehydratase family protein [Xanthobacter flavus]MDR6332508.1 UDP-glucose 4-epimerase [Xanthobacter flavus]GLI21740.1 NAD-dependent epimerase [Xanthobacter flavus]